MAVAAREASIYLGITIAEYYRDMGYDVALMVDSTSRWAEAMREISGRMEEMPSEGGFPAYLGRKLAEFYSRAGMVTCLGGDERRGSVTIIGAVSPPGGDISEPVSQNTLRIVKVFYALDASLAHRRHFPAINWLKSYSLYLDPLKEWMDRNVSADFMRMRNKAMNLLQKEAELQDIVKLVGPDSLPEKEQAILKTAMMLREDFMQQNSFDEIDSYTTFHKQHLMLKAILTFYDKAMEAADAKIPLEAILSLKAVSQIAAMNRIPNDEDGRIDELIGQMDADFKKLHEREND